MKIKCPKCGAVYNVDDSEIPDKGIYAMCHRCRERFFVEKEREETKKCPYCGEEILEVARKCKHCREDLTKKQESAGDSSSSDNIGYIMLIIPLISTLLIWLWIGTMNTLQSPFSTLNFLGIATIVITAILVTYEAHKLGFGKPSKTRRMNKETGPIGYFSGMILLWIIVFPLYLYQRSKKGRKRLVLGGILSALIFSCSWFTMGYAITRKLIR